MTNHAAEDPVIVIVGLGYVGLTLAAHLLKNGSRVHGVEIRDIVLEQLIHGKCFFHEPGIDEILSESIANGNLTFSRELLKDNNKRIFIITVGTPLNIEMKPDMGNISRVAEEVALSMNDGDMVLLRSTVKLKTTIDLVKTIIEKKHKDFYLAFCPERTLEGNALQELYFLPQIVGGIDSKSSEKAASFFRKFTKDVFQVADSTTAEMIKLVDNMQRDAQFALANEVASMCTSIGIRAKDVIEFGKNGYSRTNLPKPGPVGGPCLEKDSYILAESFLDGNPKTYMTIGARTTNLNVISSSISYLIKMLSQSVVSSPKVALLGMAFKGIPETDDLRGSPSLRFANTFQQECPSAKISIWDPLIKGDNLSELGFDVLDDLSNNLDNADLIVLLNNHPTLSNLNFMEILRNKEGVVFVYDLWDRFEQKDFMGNVKYSGWGNHE